jgi:hypothetical protein
MGCLPSLVFLAVFCLTVYFVVETVVGPWIYTVGGRQRWVPVWEGVGQAQGPGGTYTLFIWFQPSPAHQRILPETAVQGYSTLCTPKGERMNLKLYGGASGRGTWLHMPDGHEFGMNIFRRLAFNLGGPIGPPRLEFKGRWQGPNLVMDDKGGFLHAFNPDGSVNMNSHNWHNNAGAVPITFTETPFSLTPPACPAARQPP